MKRQIILSDKKIIYTLKRSKRAKKIRLAVYCDGSIVLTAPYGFKENFIERFIKSKASWLFSKILFFNKFKGKTIIKRGRKDYFKYKERARALVEKKASYFLNMYGLEIGKISIKNQKTRWGSCSKKGNLNFNYKILFLPEKIQDYIIVHEICHLKEFNHSHNFWRLVSRFIPDYLRIRRELKENFYL